MARASHDLDIFWILVLAGAFVAGIWKHVELTAWLAHTWNTLF
jgi:hypothetical protein